MDAVRTPCWVSACLCLLVGGCMADMNPAPAARTEDRTERPSERREPPQIVDDPTTQPAEPEPGDEVHQSVIGYIERIDGARERARHDDSQKKHEALPARPVADEHVPPPAESPPQPPADQQQTAEQPASAPDSQPEQQVPAPILGNISVREASRFTSEPPAGQADSPGLNAPVAARNAPVSLQDFLEQMVPPEQAGFREQLDVRILALIAGDYDRARQPLELVTAEQQALATRFIDALIAIREAHLGDLAAAATAAAGEIADLQEALRSLGDLSVPTLQICTAVRGFGQYDALTPARLLAGRTNEFVLYCEVRDFVSEQRDDGLYYTIFDLTTTILTVAGDTVLSVQDRDITDACRNRRHDCFIPRLLRLPDTLSPGQYVAKVTVVDKLGQKVAESRATFELVARP